MDDIEVGRYWDANAEAWTALSRAGYDQSRDMFNTPQFLAILPEVRGLVGLDIGCGEGHNTRLLALRGARMTALDISPKFLDYARQSERDAPLGIEYVCASAQALPFPDASFDFATAFMSLMDIPQPERAVSEAFRVVRPGGFFQFSICHPCFQTPRWQWVRDAAGQKIGIVCGDYFERRDGQIEEWIFGAAPDELKQRYPKFRIPRFFRTLSEWVNMLIGKGFVIARVQEPAPDEESIRRDPGLRGDRLFAWFLHVQCRRPRAETPQSAR
jgi:SAM-dependent methyltransferase